MITSYSFRSLAVTLATAGISLVSGCASEPNPAPGTSPESPQGEPRDMVAAYVDALQGNDAAAIDQLISAELRERIATRGSNADFQASLQRFMSRERDKLVRSVPASGAGESFTVTSSDAFSDQPVTAVHVVINGYAVPKPFYFVQEDGRQKLNVVLPGLARSDTALFEGNTYVVKNGDGVTRSFTCSGGAGGSVSAGQTLSRFCNDACGFFDGTDFTAGGASASCDFNTFGIDMTIKNGVPVCNDRC